MEYLVLGIVLVVLAAVAVAVLVVPRRRRGGVAAPPAPPAEREAVPAPEAAQPEAPELEVPAPVAGRLVRLRDRLARSQSTLGRGLLSVLSRDRLDDEAWEEVEDALLQADVGVSATGEIVERLRTRTRVLGTRSSGELRALLAEQHGLPGRGPLPADAAAPGRPAGGRARGRGERHRQDHHLRQAGPGAGRGRADRAARRGGHVPGRRG